MSSHGRGVVESTVEIEKKEKRKKKKEKRKKKKEEGRRMKDKGWKDGRIKDKG
jgi:hypothetical protein